MALFCETAEDVLALDVLPSLFSCCPLLALDADDELTEEDDASLSLVVVAADDSDVDSEDASDVLLLLLDLSTIFELLV